MLCIYIKSLLEYLGHVQAQIFPAVSGQAVRIAIIKTAGIQIVQTLIVPQILLVKQQCLKIMWLIGSLKIIF